MGRQRIGRVGLIAVAVVVGSVAGSAAASPGPRWSIQHSPNLDSASPFSELWSVACPAASTCFAVGDGQPKQSGAVIHALIERGDGATWTKMASPKVGDETYLISIACTSVTSCSAVGFDETLGDPVAVVEQWDGSAWTLSQTPSVPGASEELFQSVSCVTATDCTAVGGSYDGTGWHPLIERRNGARWSLVPTSISGELRGVSCPTPLTCTAVGDSGTKQLIAQTTDGTHWSSVTPPAVPGAKYTALNAVTCVSSSRCFAAGHFDVTASSPRSPLVEYSNGRRWSTMSVPLPAGRTSANFLGLACTTTSNCVVVGIDNAAHPSAALTLAEHYDGHGWTIEHPQNPAPHGNNWLIGIACVTSRHCTAVGNTQNRSRDSTLIETRTGESP